MRRRFTGNKAFNIDINNYFTVVALEDGLYVYLPYHTCEYCIDGDGNWRQLPANTSTKTISAGHTLSFRCDLTTSSSEDNSVFTISKKCNLKGNVMSLLFDGNATPTSLVGYNQVFRRLFFRGTNIIDASELKLPATTLAEYCYSDMFYGCASLTKAPELPATTLAGHCYSGMFFNCKSLTKAPELPATTLVFNCYSDMFGFCSKLNYIKAMFTTTPSATYTKNWVYGAATSGTFVKNKKASWNVVGANGIPSGWTIKTE
jgi:hypothetical protein